MNEYALRNDVHLKHVPPTLQFSRRWLYDQTYEQGLRAYC